jgi:hypothetical protein
MAGEQGYPWTILQKVRSQDEGGDQSVGPWHVVWKWRPGAPILVLSDRLLQHLASSGVDNSIGLYMDAQRENSHAFKNVNSALRLRDDVRKRAVKHAAYDAVLFDCRVVTQAELDKWTIECALEQIASESGNGASA